MKKYIIPLLALAGFLLWVRKRYTSGIVEGGEGTNNGTTGSGSWISSPLEGSVTDGLFEVYQNFGTFAEAVEQAFRLETAHFTSGQWTACYSPGMVATQHTSFPWGWPSLAEFAGLFPAYGITPESTEPVYFQGAGLWYVSFPDPLASIAFFSWYIINKRDGNVPAWNSLDESAQNEYYSLLSGIIPHIVRSFEDGQ